MNISTVYIAGPMTGIEGFNFPAFDLAAASLRAAGLQVFSPAEIDRAEGFNPDTDKALTHSEYMGRDLPFVCKSDAVVVLDGWQDSTGAMIETGVARALGKPILRFPDLARVDFLAPAYHPRFMQSPPAVTATTADPPEPSSETILEEAGRLVGGDRQNAYGHPIEDFTRTGVLWGGILSDHVGNDPIPPDVVGLMMVALKLSREVNKPKRDNRVDGCGYFLTVDMVRAELDKG